MMACFPMTTLWPICARLSIFVPSPIQVPAESGAVNHRARADFDIVVDLHDA